MKEFKIKVVVAEDGKVVVEDVPVHSGQELEVTIRVSEPSRATWPLRGLPVRYVDPFGPAIEDSEWDASR